jgi:hypothetical protein
MKTDEYKVISDPSSEVWTSFLMKFAGGNLQQSFDYGKVAKEANPNARVVRLLALDGDNPMGLVQAIYRKRFGIGDRLEVGGTYGNGPVTAELDSKKDVLSCLIEALENYGVSNRICEAFVYWREDWGMKEVFNEKGYEQTSSFNVYKVDLKGNVDQFWKNIAHNKRRNIMKAEAQGVQVIQGSSNKDLISFNEMLEISGNRADFIPPPFSMFNAYLKVFGAQGKAKIFLATLGGNQIAGVFVVVHGDTAYALGAGSREEAWDVRPNDILHYKAMEWACREGLLKYHMGYVSDPPPTEGSPLWGLWRWKREWKGDLEKTVLYSKVFMPNLKRFFITPYERVYSLMRRK